MGKRKKRRNRLSTPSASPSDWKASILEWLDTHGRDYEEPAGKPPGVSQMEWDAETM